MEKKKYIQPVSEAVHMEEDLLADVGRALTRSVDATHTETGATASDNQWQQGGTAADNPQWGGTTTNPTVIGSKYDPWTAWDDE